MNKRRFMAPLFLLLFGLFALVSALGEPRLAALHGSDIVRLVASGLCFGVAFGMLGAARRFPSE